MVREKSAAPDVTTNPAGNTRPVERFPSLTILTNFYRISYQSVVCFLFFQQSFASDVLQVPSPSDRTQVEQEDSANNSYVVCRFKSPPSGWVLNEGVIHLQRRASKLLSLQSNKEYKDFEILFEWRILKGGNSGVIYRAIDGRGLEYQVVDNESRWARKDKWSAGAIYDLLSPSTKNTCKPVGQWNKGRIVAVGNHIEHWLNGHKVVDYELDGEDWQLRYNESKYLPLDREDFGKVFSPIALQNHGSPAWFRNVRVRELDRSEWAASNTHEHVGNLKE